jgi:hypothetical protein
MSTNELIALCVGLMFLLACVVVFGSFADRKHSRQMLTALVKAAYNRGLEDTAVIPTPEGWPEPGTKSSPSSRT